MNESLEDESQHLSLRAIERIDVELLFGEYDYHLKPEADADNILLLYGDNGSGKTTILECIYHLLSPANNQGHRNYLSKVQFKSFGIKFNDGWRIKASRREAIAGDYELWTALPDRPLELSANFDAENKKLSGGNDNSYIKFLRRLNLDVYFLRANRKFESDSLAKNRRERVTTPTGQILEFWNDQEVPVERDEGQELRQAISKVNNFLRLKASRASNEGGASSNSIYEDVVKQIVQTARVADPPPPDRASLERRLIELGERSQSYAKFRLTAPLMVREIIEAIQAASPSALTIIAKILSPHLDSLSVRLDALESTQRLISNLVEDVNSFFTNKHVRFSLATGLQIVSSRGSKLAPENLSSGERHLLLMFCHTVVTHGKRTIFIIDEPELSLNVKWQHRIVDRLLDLADDSPTQLLFATHSIELLSQKLENTVRLIPGIGEPQ